VKDEKNGGLKGCVARTDRAAAGDYQGIIELQTRCYMGNLTPEKRRGGFLSAEFTLPQVAAMAQDLGIVVARSRGRVVAYMCASRVDLTPRPPILDGMLQSLEMLVFHGKPLSESSMFVYGPVCIDETYRGTGLLRMMFNRLATSLGDRFEVGVAFVADDNPRSLAAHLQGLAMERVARFTHDGKDYHTVVFPLVSGNRSRIGAQQGS
jgi:hypothetical protein